MEGSRGAVEEEEYYFAGRLNGSEGHYNRSGREGVDPKRLIEMELEKLELEIKSLERKLKLLEPIAEEDEEARLELIGTKALLNLYRSDAQKLAEFLTS